MSFNFNAHQWVGHGRCCEVDRAGSASQVSSDMCCGCGTTDADQVQGLSLLLHQLGKHPHLGQGGLTRRGTADSTPLTIECQSVSLGRNLGGNAVRHGQCIDPRCQGVKQAGSVCRGQSMANLYYIPHGSDGAANILGNETCLVWVLIQLTVTSGHIGTGEIRFNTISSARHCPRRALCVVLHRSSRDQPSWKEPTTETLSSLLAGNRSRVHSISRRQTSGAADGMPNETAQLPRIVSRQKTRTFTTREWPAVDR